MTQETINGLHRCQPKNVPEAGSVKSMVVLHMPAKGDKKAWIKIKSESEEKGGAPYRIISVTPTGWPPDDYGNVSMNLEIEVAQNGQKGEPPNKAPANAAQAPPVREIEEDGVAATRKHLMQSANLMLLCLRTTDYIAAQMDDKAKSAEALQGILGQLFREAYNKRSNDGVNWFSYVDFMPDKPL